MKTTKKKLKPEWELRLESRIKRLRQRAGMLKRSIKTYSDETEKGRPLEQKIKLEETNKKNTGERSNTKKIPSQDQTIQTNRTFQNNERKISQQVGVNGQSHTNNQVRKRQKDFGAKYGNGKIVTKKPNG